MSEQQQPKQLKSMSGWDSLHRSVFEIEYRGHHYAIDVDFWNDTIRLFVDGVFREEEKEKEEEEEESPATFELGDNVRIEAKAGTYGMEYARLVDDAGEHPMMAAEGTGEAWRAELDRDHPGISRAIAIASWTILAVAVVTQLSGLLEFVLFPVNLLLNLLPFDVEIEIPQIFDLPNAVDWGIIIAAIIAGIERGLRFKSGEFL